MIGMLLKSLRDAVNIPEEQKELFSTQFQPVGMMPVEFLEFMSKATRHEFKKGEMLAKQGIVNCSKYQNIYCINVYILSQFSKLRRGATITALPH
jgi:hypothetical protein